MRRPILLFVALLSVVILLPGVFAHSSAGSDNHEKGFLESRMSGFIDSMKDGGGLPLFALVVAFLLGAAHSFAPGHGKAYAAAYLIGQKRSVKHAIILGSSMAVTHVLDVIIVGLIALFLSGYILPETYMTFVNDIAAIGIIAMGFYMLYRAQNPREKLHHHHDGKHHSHDHSHKETILAGFFGGLAPCPTAWAIFLAIVGIGEIAWGLIIIIVFSLGLVLTITGIGVALVKATTLVDLDGKYSGVVRVLPYISSSAIIVLGVLMFLKVLG